MYYTYYNAYRALFEFSTPITEGSQINFLCNQPAFSYLCYSNACINPCIRRYCCCCGGN